MLSNTIAETSLNLLIICNCCFLALTGTIACAFILSTFHDEGERTVNYAATKPPAAHISRNCSSRPFQSDATKGAV